MQLTPPRDRVVRVEHVMGTAISLDIRPPWVDAAAVDEFFEWLRSVDKRFSTYREDSLVSRIRRGEISAMSADPDLTEVLALCDRVNLASHGVFDVWAHDPRGIDPSGLVKGWSIDRGAEILRRAGARNFCINAGGDVLAAGEPEAGKPWRVGIRHPRLSDQLATVCAVRDMAVATSGAYERGPHITNPTAPGAPTELLCLTVVGPGLTITDAYATAAFAMGEAGVRWLADLPGYGVCAVTGQERIVWDEVFADLIAP
ncbi:MAG: FAD:protein FMN transferase [Candidatus Dormibacteria bacterium]